LDTTVPPTQQARYQLNPNYVVFVKQNIDKLLVVGFIKPVEEATWLLLIVVVPKKNGKLRICVDSGNSTQQQRKILTYHLLRMRMRLLT
jgi:hypothetical protein